MYDCRAFIRLDTGLYAWKLQCERFQLQKHVIGSLECYCNTCLLAWGEKGRDSHSLTLSFPLSPNALPPPPPPPRPRYTHFLLLEKIQACRRRGHHMWGLSTEGFIELSGKKLQNFFQESKQHSKDPWFTFAKYLRDSEKRNSVGRMK